jgi:hypothetical protein
MATGSVTTVDQTTPRINKLQEQADKSTDSITNAALANAPFSLNQYPAITDRFKEHRADLKDRDEKIKGDDKGRLQVAKQFTDLTGASSLDWKSSLRLFSVASDRVAFKARFFSTFTALTQNYFYWSNTTVDHYHPSASSYRYTFRPHFELSCEGAEDISDIWGMKTFPKMTVSTRRSTLFILWFSLGGLADSAKFLKALGLL